MCDLTDANIIDSDRRWRERVSKTNDQFLSSPLVALSVQTKLDDFEPKSLIWTSDAGVQVAMMQRRGQNVKHAMRTVSLPLANKGNKYVCKYLSGKYITQGILTYVNSKY